MTIPKSCDVVVVGGGPAGSSAASFLARDGYDVVLLEKERHPRFTVGESLLPHVWRFFDMLGVTPAIEREGFVAKQGGTVVWDGRIRQISFAAFGFRRPGLHTERDRLDFLLLEHSRKVGARVYENVVVREVLLSGEAGNPEVRYHEPANGGEGRIRCRYVIDASGQSAVLSRQLGMRRIDEDFRFVALWGYFTNSKYVAADGRVYPFASVREIAPTTFVGSIGGYGWAWHIPMRETTSVGVVIPLERFKTTKQDNEDLEPYFLRMLREVPYLGGLLADARPVPGGFHVIRDYSYVPAQVVGPRYFIVGDAAAFVDPVFSLGVVLGLYSGHLSAWAIDRSFKNPAKEESSRDIFAQ
ncbi:MAG TPA: NAD(P)/FAD-dependent oxidoreductase, partial [Burkholderiales bacterium]|nr:NAD(P)/FAD-dependent oxidoreductase [Burkholderiales bacterium]